MVAPAHAARPRLELRALTGWEEELVERHAGEPNTARVCNELLARCLVAPGEDPGGARATVRELLVVERDRELVALRRLSLGAGVSARVVCPQCGEQSEADFSLDALPLEFDITPGPVRVELDDSGEAVLRLPTAGDQEDLADAGLDGDAARRSWVIARCLVRYGDREEDLDLDFARGLPIAVRAQLEAAIERRLPDVALEMAVDCASCGAAVVVPFDVPAFFFRAERPRPCAAARRARARPRIRLGRARHPLPDARPPARLPADARGRRRRRAARRPGRGWAGMSGVKARR